MLKRIVSGRASVLESPCSTEQVPGRRCSWVVDCSSGRAMSKAAGPRPIGRRIDRILCMQGGRMPPPQDRPVPVPRPAPAMPQQQVFLELSQVLGKQVITRTSGRSLGTISGCWMDPARGSLVSFDIEEKKASLLGSSQRAGNIPLAALRQIGDVVLVHDERGLYEADLDGRMGFIDPVGLELKTRAGEFLGKVRDLSFSPDSGAITRLIYDEFGLPSLPLSFFDCFSVSAEDVMSVGRAEVIVYDNAKYRERKESNGLFAAIPSLFKSLNPGRSGGGVLALPAAGTSEAYRSGGPAGYLPANYSYEQWQADLRRWEAETGMTYEQYLRGQSGRTPRAALPAARSSTPSSSSQQGYSQPGAAAGGGYGRVGTAAAGAGYSSPGPGRAPAGAVGGAPLSQQQQQQQRMGQQGPVPGQYGGGGPGYSAGAAPGGGAGWSAAGQYGQQQPRPGPSPQQQQYGAPQGPAGAAAGGPLRSGNSLPQAQQRPPPQQQQQQQAPPAYGANKSSSSNTYRPFQQQQQQPQAPMSREGSRFDTGTAAAGGSDPRQWKGAAATGAGSAGAGFGAGLAGARGAPGGAMGSAGGAMAGQQGRQAAAPAGGGAAMGAMFAQQQQPLQGTGVSGFVQGSAGTPGGVREEVGAGRRVDEWIVKEPQQPRMAEMLAEGVLPPAMRSSGEGGGAAMGSAEEGPGPLPPFESRGGGNGAGEGQQQQQPQQLQQQQA